VIEHWMAALALMRQALDHLDETERVSLPACYLDLAINYLERESQQR
jgi:hypothetical protein